MTTPFSPLTLRRGRPLPHRIALAPLTNGQSGPDGVISQAEHHWLEMRARGGFALTMTCAAHVQAAGQGFAGQLGIFSDRHVPGLAALAEAIHRHRSLAVVQLHHAGMRAPRDLIGRDPLCPSVDDKRGAVAMSEGEIEQVIEDFVLAAQRADRAGFDGVELHGAHGYLIGQFLSAGINRRTDAYGGSPHKRAHLLWRIADGIRARCREDFQLGLRLSPERFGVDLGEMRDLARDVLACGAFEYLDLSLWDVFKRPAGQDSGPTLFEHFVDLPRTGTRVGVAGNIRTPADLRRCLDMGADFVFLGRAAIVDHDFPNRLRQDENFVPSPMPASLAHLARQGVTPPFLDYLRRFDGLVMTGAEPQAR